jgi:enoyl-CoA hydratase/carnithine racemase
MSIQVTQADGVATLLLNRPDKLTEDHKEGVAASREKRPPKFLGK